MIGVATVLDMKVLLAGAQDVICSAFKKSHVMMVISGLEKAAMASVVLKKASPDQAAQLRTQTYVKKNVETGVLSCMTNATMAT